MKKEKYLALILAGITAFCTGCGSSTEGLKQDEGAGSHPENDVENDESDEADYIQAAAKGRFLESDVTLPEGVGLGIKDIEALTDGSIALFDSYAGYFISEDGGESFAQKEIPAIDELIKNNVYITEALIGKDGSLFATTYSSEAEDGYAAVTGDEANVTEKESRTITNYYVDAEGNCVSCGEFKEIGLTDRYAMTEDGMILAAADGIYKLDIEAGAAEKICETKSPVGDVKVIGDKLYIVEDNPVAVEIYDMGKKEMTEDALLNQFCQEHDLIDNSTVGIHSILFYPGDTEDSIYIASRQGVFRHVANGSVMEEVIKGSLSSMGSPNNGLSDLIQLTKESFIICYNSTFLKKYVYDPNAETVPKNQIKVYSLEENNAIRIAMDLYQNEHPDTYIEYEVGMTDEDGETSLDAIRSLNTKLLSGEGPDVIVLDGLNMSSYMDKGILEDLSELTDGKEDLYENVVNAYEKDGKICCLPVVFELPLLAGQNVDDIDSVTDFADYVENRHAQKPEGSVTGSYTERSVLNRLYEVCSAGFVKEDGSIDAEKLKIYLNAAQRIWRADSENMDEEKASWRREREDGETEGDHIDYSYYEKYLAGNGMSYMTGELQVLYGKIQGISWDYSDVVSAFHSVNEQPQIRVMGGFGEKVFVPNTVVGVNSSSKMKDAAKDFVQSMLSEKIQSGLLGSGIPVNKSVVLSAETEYEYGEVMGSYGTSGPDGEEISMEAIWPTREEFDVLEQMLDSLTTPACLNNTIRDIVMEQGTAALKEEKSIDDAVNEILNSVQIYLAE